MQSFIKYQPIVTVTGNYFRSTTQVKYTSCRHYMIREFNFEKQKWGAWKRVSADYLLLVLNLTISDFKFIKGKVHQIPATTMSKED